MSTVQEEITSNKDQNKNQEKGGEKLWEHSSPERTAMYQFKRYISEKYSREFSDEEDKLNSLWAWSVDEIESFWSEVWHYTGIKASKRFDSVIDVNSPMFPRPAWFSGALLNFAENLLFPQLRDNGGDAVDENAIAVIAATEENEREYVTWKELRERVRVCAAALKQRVKQGDVVAGEKCRSPEREKKKKLGLLLEGSAEADMSDTGRIGYVANHTNALVAMLASTSLGCVWTGISPDHGTTAVLDRLVQLEPKVFFADSGVLYNGKIHKVMPKLGEITAALLNLETAVIFNNFGLRIDVQSVKPKGRDECQVWQYEDFEQTGDQNSPLEFLQLSPDIPVYVLFSSGTTGKPKCICHGAIGTLIQHKKEHMIHCDIGPGSVFFQFTTVTWMMWHWLVSGLASGATIVLYDGSPFRPLIGEGGNLAMATLIDELGVTNFGTSAKYLSILEQSNVHPKDKYPMKNLKAIYSTASVLAPSTFEYVYSAFGPDLDLGSITGGTDIISLFGAPSPLVPVYSGEIQCLGLGMKVEAWDGSKYNVEDSGETGDLVCVKPFPCMPVKFWGKDGEAVYKKSYFEEFPVTGVWHHGDFVKINPKTRGLQMLGRSDAILKPAGVRIGSAEIYNALLANFPTQFEDAVCVGRRRASDTDEHVVLFVKMSSGALLTPQLIATVKGTIRRELSARHVPVVIDATPEIPVTTNGKKVEVAVKQIVSGINVKVSASVANVECLEWFRQWAREN
ncbi:acetoacetate-CoA ligase [Choiromyces venosus 120613-1]|uniref:Acetoacetate-CoA ligase n=1 Tax=Choiromyces venosus 120613-1 TaxID=1336337 RepID=A0A3N4JCE7_9PEZI|nr:acetoacetate-CoA ligase [Choiromyces venosus 120613-1]